MACTATLRHRRASLSVPRCFDEALVDFRPAINFNTIRTPSSKYPSSLDLFIQASLSADFQSAFLKYLRYPSINNFPAMAEREVLKAEKDCEFNIHSISEQISPIFLTS